MVTINEVTIVVDGGKVKIVTKQGKEAEFELREDVEGLLLSNLK